MKSAIIPQVRVEPALRSEMEQVLREGESLSEFIEASVRSAVAFRLAQAEFHARGEAAWQRLQRGGQPRTDAEVGERLDALTQVRRQQLGL